MKKCGLYYTDLFEKIYLVDGDEVSMMWITDNGECRSMKSFMEPEHLTILSGRSSLVETVLEWEE